MVRRLVIGFVVLFVLLGCSAVKTISYYEQRSEIESLEVHEGIICQHAMRINYYMDGKKVATIELSEPVMVAQANQEEEWGFFQFPNIGVDNDGTIIVSWQMKEDSPAMYGIKSNRTYKPMMSKDKGKTWRIQDKKYLVRRVGNYVRLHDGTVLQTTTPAAKNITTDIHISRSVGSKKRYNYYLVTDLPEEFQGAYIHYQKEGLSEIIHATIFDPGLVRYSYDGFLSAMWKGNMKQLANKALIAGVYPANYLDSLGNVLTGGISFYQSNDLGQSWKVIGKIPFVNDGLAVDRGGLGFEEPSFEILNDSTFLCVMRSGAMSPMYKTYSSDQGHTWSRPIPFTPNGVKPCLMTLKNGILVLSSGRPGVQLRFSLDGTGSSWTEPIDMIPFMNPDGSFIRDVSCGYTSLIDVGNDSIYMVYSDFTTKDLSGNPRKSIWFRKIKIENK